MKGKIKTTAFVVYPIKDMVRARAFYEKTLGLEVTANWDDAWVEYDIGENTLAITNSFPDHQPGAKGAVLALEVSDFDDVLQDLEEKSIPLSSGPFDSPSCRGCSIQDPDGNELILHAKK